MKLTIFAVLVLCVTGWGKDILQVEVRAVHAVTHEDRGLRATLDKGLSGSHSTTKQQESFNVDAIIAGEHVLLVCDDTKGCEAPALGTYEGERKRGKWVTITFALPMQSKPVTRWYKIAGSW